jgi:hypothetical protein
MHDQIKDAKIMEATVERFESLSDEEMNGKGLTPPEAMGTVNFTDLTEVYLVPAPSADPRGTVSLNDVDNTILTTTQIPSTCQSGGRFCSLCSCQFVSYVILVKQWLANDHRVSSLGLSLVSGFGGLLQFYIPIYAAHGATYEDITALMTFPSMFMGVGCLVGMPLALAIGRRPVYLGSLVILVLAAILAAYAKDYNWHLGARMILGFAAGQSEALVPMMIQVLHQQ